MNVFNRIAMSLILVAFIAVTLVISLLPMPTIIALLNALEVAETGITPATQLIGALVGLLMTVAAFLLLVAELRPPTRQSVIVAQMAGGTAELTNESVALRVKRVAESIIGVREAAPTIRSRGKAVDIQLRLNTDADIDIPQKSEEVVQAVRSEAETRMGVPVRSLKVTVRHSGADRRGSTPEADTAGSDPFRV